MSSLTNPNNSNIHDTDEINTSVELTIQRFLDAARQLECFFLQKRLILSVEKPELLLAEDCTELRNEILRKDQVLQKYYEKLQIWQGILNDTGTVPPNLQRQPSLLGQQNVVPPTPQQTQPTIAGTPTMPMRHQTPVTGQSHMIPGPVQSQIPPQIPPAGMPINQGHIPGSGMMPMQSGMHPPPQSLPQTPQPGPTANIINPMAQSQMPQQFIPQQQQHAGGLQGPLAFLERTTSNIGLPDSRR